MSCRQVCNSRFRYSEPVTCIYVDMYIVRYLLIKFDAWSTNSTSDQRSVWGERYRVSSYHLVSYDTSSIVAFVVFALIIH